MGLIGVAVAALYSDTPKKETASESVSHSGILAAVPSDAAMVFSFENAKEGLKLLGDPSKCFGSFIGGNKALRGFLLWSKDSCSFKSVPMAVSLHFSGVLEPLVVLDAGHASADTSGFERQLFDAAEASGLKAAFASSDRGRYMLISGSGPLVESSVRHLDTSHSILDDSSFSSLAASASSRNIVLVSHNYAGKILTAMGRDPLYKHSSFLRKFADWSMFEVESSSERRLSLRGSKVSGRNPGQYSNLLDAQECGSVAFADVAPAGTVCAVSLPVRDLGAYMQSYNAYLDASMRLSKFKKESAAVAAKIGQTPEKFAASLGIVEVARVSWNTEGGACLAATLVRTADKGSDQPADSCAFGGVFPLLFGEVFAAGDTCFSMRHGEWIAAGSEEALAGLAASWESGMTLAGTLDACSLLQMIPSKASKAVAFFSAGDARKQMPSWFKRVLSDDLALTLDGALAEYFVFSYGEDGFSLEVGRPEGYDKSKQGQSKQTVARKVPVEVPAGPFEVKNCATGKTNLFYQNANGYLCLKEADTGKGLWGVPFDGTLCGAVSGIDYYANGKIQFLFASGSKIYLIDRLGRFVKDFPVDLGKEILIGPDAYDFSGAKGYTVVVLHKDNTIGMYNIHGQAPAGWQGITSEHTITSLPVSAHIGDRKCWVVKTAGGEFVYDFLGGEPLKQKALKNLEY